MLSTVRWFEQSLQASLLAKAKHNRAINPNKVFKDFATPAVSPVCILQDVAQAKVVAVDETDFSVTLDPSQDFWPGELVGSQGPFQPIVTCEDKVWVDSLDGFAIGQILRQERFVGQLDEVFSRFQTE